MSEGLFGRLLSGVFGWMTEPEKPRPLDQRGLEYAMQMRQMDPKSPAALALARGLANTPKEEQERRMREFYEREYRAACKPFTPPAETETTHPTTPPQPKSESP